MMRSGRACDETRDRVVARAQIEVPSTNKGSITKVSARTPCDQCGVTDRFATARSRIQYDRSGRDTGRRCVTTQWKCRPCKKVNDRINKRRARMGQAGRFIPDRTNIQWHASDIRLAAFIARFKLNPNRSVFDD